MAWPTIFANLAAGNQPLTILDNMFAQVAQLIAIPCTAVGNNAIQLTLIGNAPIVSSYQNFQMFRFKAAGTSSGLVTIQFASLGALNAYKKDGVTQISTSDVVINNEYLAVFDQSRNSGNGGFYLEDAAQGPAGGGGGAVATPAQILLTSQTVTIPANATKLLVTLVGGGGGGASPANGACAVQVGGPGGPAAGLQKYLTGMVPGNTLILTIGAGGTGPAGPNVAGGNGGDTTLASGTQAITTLTAGKGFGGTTAGVAGAAGTATNGDDNLPGTASLALANLGINTLSQITGESPFGLGPAHYQVNPSAATASVNGIPATGFGGAGTGGISGTAGATASGGAGTPGYALFQWFQ